jgi:hypothetical protein
MDIIATHFDHNPELEHGAMWGIEHLRHRTKPFKPILEQLIVWLLGSLLPRAVVTTKRH